MEVAGSMSSIARAVEASLDRLDNIMDIPSLDENGADLVPENFNIEVKNMSFGYGEKEVLHQISLSVPQGLSLIHIFRHRCERKAAHRAGRGIRHRLCRLCKVQRVVCVCLSKLFL